MSSSTAAGGGEGGGGGDSQKRDAGGYGLSTLMDACEEHRKSHAQGQQQEETMKSHCIAILQKLKNVLPKLMKVYFSPRTSSCEDVKNMCQLLKMILSKTMCEHGDEVFDSGELPVEAQVAQVAPRIFTTWKLMTEPRFVDVHEDIMDTCCQLLNLVQASNLAAYDQLFSDIVVIMQDGHCLLQLILRPNVRLEDLLSSECRLLTFQGTIQLANESLASVMDEGKDQPPQQPEGGAAAATSSTASVTSAASNQAMEADSAALAMTSVHSVFLLLLSSTRVLKAMLQPFEILANSPALWQFCRALCSQLLLLANPQILTLPFPDPTSSSNPEQIGQIVQTLRRSTLEALSGLLVTANEPPEGVQVHIVSTILGFVNGQLRLAAASSGEEEEGAGERRKIMMMKQGGMLCDMAFLAPLLRCLMSILGESTSVETLIPTAIPGLMASLRLCMPCGAIPEPQGNAERDARDRSHLRLIRHVLLWSFRRALLASGPCIRHLSILDMGVELADRWYLTDTLLCWFAAMDRFPDVALDALYTWAGHASKMTRKRPRVQSFNQTSSAVKAAAGGGGGSNGGGGAGGDAGQQEGGRVEGQKQKKRKSASLSKGPRAISLGDAMFEDEDAAAEGGGEGPMGEEDGDDDDDDDEFEIGEEEEGEGRVGLQRMDVVVLTANKRGDSDRGGGGKAATAAGMDPKEGGGGKGDYTRILGHPLLLWTLLKGALDRGSEAVIELERLSQINDVDIQAWLRQMTVAGIHASTALQLAIYGVSGTDNVIKGDNEEKSKWTSLIASVSSSAAKLLPLLPLSRTDMFLRTTFPHIPLNVALTCASAIPLGAARVGRHPQDLSELVLAVGRSAMGALECFTRPTHVKAMLAEAPEGVSGGIWEPLREDDEPEEAAGGGGENLVILKAAQRLAWLDKLVVLVCSAGSLSSSHHQQGEGGTHHTPPSSATQDNVSLQICLRKYVNDKAALAFISEALSKVPVLEGILQILASENVDRNVCGVLFRYMPVLMETLTHDIEGLAMDYLPLLTTAALAVGLRLLDEWYAPTDPSWHDLKDPAMPGLAQWLARLIRLVGIKGRPAAAEEKRKEQREEEGTPTFTGAIVPANEKKQQRQKHKEKEKKSPTIPRVRLLASCLNEREGQVEDLGQSQTCPAKHVDLLLTIGLSYRRLLNIEVHPTARIEAVKALFNLLALAPAATLYSEAIKPIVHSLFLILIGMLADPDIDVRDVVAEWVVILFVDDAKLARLIFRQEGFSSSSGSISSSSRRRANEDKTPHPDPASISVDEALGNLITRFKTLIKDQQEINFEADFESPFFLSTLIQAIGAIATRLPAMPIHEVSFLWVVLKLVDIWGERGMYASFAYEQLVRIARQGRLSLEDTIATNADQILPPLLRSLVQQGMLEDFVREVLVEENSPRNFLELSLKYAIAAAIRDESQQDLEVLAESWSKHIYPVVINRLKPELQALFADASPIERMLLHTSAVVPRILFEDYRALDYLCQLLKVSRYSIAELVGQDDQKMMCEVIWEMAEAEDKGDIDRQEKAREALSILTYLKYSDPRRGQGEREDEGGESSEMMGTQMEVDEAGHPSKATPEMVKSFVASNFLYVISTSVLSWDWDQRSMKKRALSMRCLRLMLENMAHEKVPVFIPKYMSIMNFVLWEGGQASSHHHQAAASSSHANGGSNSGANGGGGPIAAAAEAGAEGTAGEALEVKETACLALSSFVRLLSDAELRANISVIVVTMLPAIHPMAKWAGDEILYNNRPEKQAPLPPTSLGRATLLQLLHWLIVTKRNDLASSFPSIPFLPALPELEEARQVLAEEVLTTGPLSLQLRRLIILLAHDSPEVRYATLRQLRATLGSNREQLFQLILGSDVAEDVISELMTVLLRISSEEKKDDMSQACCACLGELGAIDPARVTITLFATKTGGGAEGGGGSGNRRGESTPSTSSSSSPSSSPPLHPPWTTNDSNIALVLLQYILVPKLRAAATDKDRFPYAIQELLRLLYNRGPSGGSRDETAIVAAAANADDGGGKATKGRQTRAAAAAAAAASAAAAGEGGGEAAENTQVVHSSKNTGPMPSWMQGALTECDLLEIVKPFWFTNYVVKKGTDPRGPPFFSTGQSFETSLSQCVRYFLEVTKGPFSDVMYACRGLVRQAHALPLFFLPYLVAEIWCFGSKEAREVLLKEVMWVLQRRSMTVDDATEAGGAGGGRRDSTDHVATQAILSLVDTLTDWCGRPSSAAGQQAAAAAEEEGGGEEGGEEVKSTGTWTPMPGRLRTFLAEIPDMLLIEASMRIRAYTRALKYLESYVRKVQRRPTSSSSPHSPPANLSAADVTLVPNAPYLTGQEPPLTAGNAMAMYSPTATDGANNTLPLLQSSQIDLFQQIFSCLDEPDSMTGLAAARRKAGRTTTLRQRIREYEHAEEWSNALQGYEQALQELEQRGGVATINGSGSSSGSTTSSSSSSKRGGSRTTPSKQKGGEEAAAAATAAAAVISENEVELSRGLLQSILEMDQVESVLNQFLGMVSRKPALEPHLLSVGAEACWRLQKWPALHEILSEAASGPRSVGVDERFQLALGQVLHGLHKRSSKEFGKALRVARHESMATLSAASMESYQRAYPSLVRLHILHELEQGFELVRSRDSGSSSTSSSSSKGGSAASSRSISAFCDDEEDGDEDGLRGRKLLDEWQWDGRLAVMMTSVRQCAPVVAARRTLFQMCRFRSMMAENWVNTSRRAVEAGRFGLAESALRHAACLGLEGERLILEEAKLLHAQEKVHEALLLLEPVDQDLWLLRKRLFELIKSGGMAIREECKRQAAIRLLLATDWIVEAGVKHGQVIIDRYKLALELFGKSEACYFSLGKYTDFLLEARRKELMENAGGGREAMLTAAAEDEVFHTYLRQTIESYASSLYHGLEHIFQSMPRLLTLWFEVGDMVDMAYTSAASAASNTRGGRGSHAGGGGGNGSKSNGYHTNATILMDKLLLACQVTVRRAIQQISSCAWYTCLPQLLSQIAAGREEIQALTKEAVVKVLISHPEQAMWSITGLAFSKEPNRKKISERILRTACSRLSESDQPDVARMLNDSKKLFQDLIDLATNQDEPQGAGGDKRIKCQIGKRLALSRFLVPVQAALTVSLPRSSPRSLFTVNAGASGYSQLGHGSGGAGGGGRIGDQSYHDAFPNSQMQIRCFADSAMVLHSKAKPKKITITTICEKRITFLCKQERSGDLRKDARMMEFNGIINRLLQRDAEGRRRKLKLRKYAVVCLNEECGLMEWVPNTVCLRTCVNESAKLAGTYSRDQFNFREIRAIFDRIQNDYKDDVPAMIAEYKNHVLPRFPPSLRHWFLNQYPEPTAWFEARTNFTRSVAVWSVVGHVVGLGDRHGENILLDTESGEAVHVDFDCLFDKGLTLARPELVPFRLTPNMVDAMGVLGYEGPYRRVMEVSLAVLREHRQTLLSVLEPFLSDHISKIYNIPGSGSQLTIIDERLRGIYNLRLPQRAKASKKSSSAGEGGGSSRGSQGALPRSEVALPLSIPGQVQKLIQEATSLENLSVMYIGWMPFL